MASVRRVHGASGGGTTEPPVKVAYFVEWFPKLSETFIQREIDGLIGHGIEVEVFPYAAMPRRQVRFGYPVRYAGKAAFLRLPGNVVRELKGHRGLVREALRLLGRHVSMHPESWYMTLMGVVTALRHAERLRGGDYRLLHAAWAHGPATAAAVLHCLTGIPFSVAGHARDIYRHGGDAFLEEKLRAARFVHTTTRANAAYLAERGARGRDIVLARRGLPGLPGEVVRRLAPERLRLLSVGRLIRKKGHHLQVEACRMLARRGVGFHLRIVGGGRLRKCIEAQRDRAGLKAEIELCGPLEQAGVQEMYRWADVLIHSGVIEANGDRDGLPNVVPEAMSHALAVVVSRTPGVTEAVEHERTGLHFEPGRPAALADAIARLASDHALRLRLGRAARVWVEEHFALARNTAVLAGAMRRAARREADPS